MSFFFFSLLLGCPKIVWFPSFPAKMPNHFGGTVAMSVDCLTFWTWRPQGQSLRPFQQPPASSKSP